MTTQRRGLQKQKMGTVPRPQVAVGRWPSQVGPIMAPRGPDRGGPQQPHTCMAPQGGQDAGRPTWPPLLSDSRHSRISGTPRRRPTEHPGHSRHTECGFPAQSHAGAETRPRPRPTPPQPPQTKGLSPPTPLGCCGPGGGQGALGTDSAPHRAGQQDGQTHSNTCFRDKRTSKMPDLTVKGGGSPMSGAGGRWPAWAC